MQQLHFSFPASRVVSGRAHVGVVSSGDLEILMQPSGGNQAQIDVRTSVAGYDAIWEATLQRFVTRADALLRIEINDFGATPGMLLLRLQQALSQMERDHA